MKNVIIYLILFAFIGCSDSEYYKVQFEDVDRLNEGDKVILKGLEVGEVTGLRLDDKRKLLATISVGRGIKVTKGSAFAIHAEFPGIRYIEIKLADSDEFIDPNEIQTGYVQPPDTAGIRHYTPEERDSLIEHNPVLKLADTLITILRKSAPPEKD